MIQNDINNMDINIGEILESSFNSYFYPVIAPIIRSLIIGFVFVVVGWVISLATGSKAIFTFVRYAAFVVVVVLIIKEYQNFEFPTLSIK